MKPAVELDALSVAFGATRAVDAVSLAVHYGEIVALLGPNGAGKTTLVETTLGFRRPSGGAVRVHGADPVRQHDAVVRETGALLQRGGVWFPMSPRQVLELTAHYYDDPRDPAELLERFGLRDCARTPWRRLSGGEQQRTLLALALLGRPRLLILDEPTTAVDPEGRLVIRRALRDEAARGVAIVVTTHELSEAEASADRLVILSRGRILAEGTVAELGGTDTLVVEVSGAVDLDALGARLGRPAQREGDTVRLVGASEPTDVARATDELARQGATVRSLRTQASLEERYLELVRGNQP